MTEYWKVSKPQLIISVTGGAQDFIATKCLKNFKRDLTSAAAYTGKVIRVNLPILPGRA